MCRTSANSENLKFFMGLRKERKMTHDPKDKVFYVYKWVDLDSNKVVYVGKGCDIRFKDKRPSRRSKYFMRYVKKHTCTSEIIQDHLSEKDAYDLEEQIIKFYKLKNECILNFDNGGRRGGRSPGKLNGMYGKTHTPEAIKKIKLANQKLIGKLNNNARCCQILDQNHILLYEFQCVIDLTNKYIELHEQEYHQKYSFSTARTYIARVKNKEQLLDKKYYIRIFRKKS